MHVIPLPLAYVYKNNHLKIDEVAEMNVIL
jgi:hypothetical protein